MYKPHLSPADQLAETQAKFNSLRRCFIMGWLGEPTFRLSLKFLGLVGQALDAEVNLAKMEIKSCQNGKTVATP